MMHTHTPATTTHTRSPSHGRIALALFALLAGIYLLTTGGHTSSKDEELLFGVTESLVRWQSFALNAARPNDTPIYSYYGPGQPITAMPLYALGRTLAALFPEDAYPWVTRVITLWLNPLVVAATGALVYLAVVLLDYSRRIAIATTFIYGFATMAWPYSKTFFSEPLTAMPLFAAFVLLLYDCKQQQSGNSGVSRSMVLLVLSGFLATYALTVKVHGALIFPFVALYAGMCLLPTTLPFAWKNVVQQAALRKTIVVRWLAWGLGAAIVFALLGLYQWHLYGDPFSTGYGSSVFSHFNPKYFWYRLSGLVWSPGRGIIWYAPPTMLWPIGMWLLWKRNWQVTLVCGAVVFAHLGFYALLLYWHGGGSWGPRYLTIALPFLVLPLAAFLQTLRGWRTPWRTGLLILTLLITIPVQLGGVAIANEAFFSTKRNVERDHFDPFDSAIAGHLGLVVEHLNDYYQVFFAPNSIAFQRGFAYSEGDREEGEQVPRWSNQASATLDLRPPPDADTVQLELALHGCLPPPLDPRPITLRTRNETLIAATPCPPRVYHLLLPARRTKLLLASPLWTPAEVGIEREGQLGVLVRDLQARADGKDLTVQGTLIPISPMPTGYVSIRRWTGDHRLNHWDTWLWYVTFSDLPPAPLRLLVGIWLTLALGLIAWGSYQLLRR